MAFENMFVSVGGIRKWLENCDLSSFTVNDLASTYRCRTINNSETDPLLEYNMELSYGDAGFEEWKNVFGFFIYDSTTGDFTGKILWYRIYCYIHQVIDPSDNYIWAFEHKWSIFDSETQQYNDIVTGPNPTASGGANQLRLPSCKIIFSKMTETYQNEEQDMFYGGLMTYKYFQDVTIAEGNAIALPSKAGLESLGYTIKPEEVVIDPDLGPESGEDGYGPDEGGKSPTGGGTGGPAPTFDEASDPWIDYPTKPGIAALGLVNLYKCDVGSLVNLGAEIFPDIHFPTSLSDVGAVLAAFSDSIWNSKLIDYIVSAHIIPVGVTGGNLEDIKVGTRTMTGILARPITDDIVEFDCGTLHIDEYYTNFVDYMTKCKVYIPFYGMVEIKPEYWQSADLQLKYRFNVIDGSFVAMLYSTISRHQKQFKSLIGQYTGCACVHVPMTGAAYASMFSGMISGVAGMATSLATGNPALAATSAINTAQAANGNMEMSNSYNASAGFYGHPCPYLIIERPISHFSGNYAAERGLPLLVKKTVGSVTGFTVAEDIILNGIPATKDELDRIKTLFKSGVIIK
jgi:hypothetical protein